MSNNLCPTVHQLLNVEKVDIKNLTKIYDISSRYLIHEINHVYQYSIAQYTYRILLFALIQKMETLCTILYKHKYVLISSIYSVLLTNDSPIVQFKFCVFIITVNQTRFCSKLIRNCSFRKQFKIF